MGMRPRKRIVASAVALFAANGYRETTIKAVVAHAKASSALFYRAFGSKEALFAEALSMAVNTLCKPFPSENSSFKRIRGVQDSATLISRALADPQWRGPALVALTTTGQIHDQKWPEKQNNAIYITNVIDKRKILRYKVRRVITAG
jgi:AcrR family transcriptional regulator